MSAVKTYTAMLMDAWKASGVYPAEIAISKADIDQMLSDKYSASFLEATEGGHTFLGAKVIVMPYLPSIQKEARVRKRPSIQEVPQVVSDGEPPPAPERIQERKKVTPVQWTTDKMLDVMDRRAAGETYKSIAARYGLTTERIRQLLAKWNRRMRDDPLADGRVDIADARYMLKALETAFGLEAIPVPPPRPPLPIPPQVCCPYCKRSFGLPATPL